MKKLFCALLAFVMAFALLVPVSAEDLPITHDPDYLPGAKQLSPMSFRAIAGKEFTLEIEVTPPRKGTVESITYQWYRRSITSNKFAEDTVEKIEGATEPKLTLTAQFQEKVSGARFLSGNMLESYAYYCTVSTTVVDGSFRCYGGTASNNFYVRTYYDFAGLSNYLKTQLDAGFSNFLWALVDCAALPFVMVVDWFGDAF